jgi:hypothetical protein
MWSGFAFRFRKARGQTTVFGANLKTAFFPTPPLPLLVSLHIINFDLRNL